MAILQEVHKYNQLEPVSDRDWIGYTEFGLLWEEAEKAYDRGYEFIIEPRVAFTQLYTGGIPK